MLYSINTSSLTHYIISPVCEHTCVSCRVSPVWCKRQHVSEAVSLPCKDSLMVRFFSQRHRERGERSLLRQVRRRCRVTDVEEDRKRDGGGGGRGKGVRSRTRARFRWERRKETSKTSVHEIR